MAFTVSITIPGDAQTEGSAAYRVKEAVDWLYKDRPEEQPTTTSDYHDIIADWMKNALRHQVRRQEEDKARRQALESIDNIDVTTE